MGTATMPNQVQLSGIEGCFKLGRSGPIPKELEKTKDILSMPRVLEHVLYTRFRRKPVIWNDDRVF
jgi:hypothetical protein